ncbi:membrane protein involved in the export of O-antigen and teichoic acid [Xenococcus sp. PCC 7305]|uniref:flippase n=1 Tax=Xenococcus sp. PCC 7305 TaxID=102125 RepID=UPI0002ACB4F1|nr:flippase [Xenococcus sp. PCC 7305]ELS03109.1 membrane protein involved in the export of O-antigen and teichoic acid [Xenococcus sp. PCC 7305]
MFKKIATIIDNFSPGLQKIIRNIGWLMIEKVFAMIVNFSIVIYLVRYLGVENFGKLSYCISFVALFEAITKLGLNGIVVRNLVREPEAKNTILGTAFILKVLGSIVACSLVIISSAKFNYNQELHTINMILAWGLIFTAFDNIDYWFESQVNSKAISLIRSIQLVITSALKLLFIWLNFSLIAFAWLIFGDYLLKAVLKIWIYSQYRFSIFSWKFDFARAQLVLRDSFPLILSSVMITIYMKIDQVMLGNMTNSVAVGNYATAVKFSEIWYFFPVAICGSCFPAIIRVRKESLKKYHAKLQQLYDLMVAIAVGIAIPTTFLAKPLLTYLLGTEYAKAGIILSWHIWAGVFVFLGVARSKWLMIENLTIFNFATTSLGALTNVVLNLWLIPLYQGVGAAIATIISYAVATYLSCIFYTPMRQTGLMLTKSLLIIFRWRQNLIYLNQIRKVFKNKSLR